jgi:Predicted dehydrogenases and related proteins
MRWHPAWSSPRRQPFSKTSCARRWRNTTCAPFVLEKPVAKTPDAAAATLHAIAAAGKRMRVGYTLLFTTWCEALVWPPAEPGARVTVEWEFLAHHFAQGLDVWKRRTGDGGGVLRFYGVQLIALLARRGYDAVLESTTAGAIVTEPERWQAKFSGPGLPPCAVSVDSRAQATRFRIVADTPGSHRVLVDLSSPFSEGGVSANVNDPRVPALIALLGSLDDDESKWVSFYGTVNDLWGRVETVTSSLPGR